MQLIYQELGTAINILLGHTKVIKISSYYSWTTRHGQKLVILTHDFSSNFQIKSRRLIKNLLLQFINT